MRGFNGSNPFKLVPIARATAYDCAKEGVRTGAGYYATVNARVANYPVLSGFMREMCTKFPALREEGMDLDPHDLTAWVNDQLVNNEELRALSAPVWNTTRLNVCSDCFQVVAGTEETLDADRLGEIHTALDRMTGTVHPGDATDEFSWRPCELCGSKLGGSRHEIINLTKGGK